MKIERAKSLGFCFGVRRAIDIAQSHPGATTYGPLIHNKDEISRLKNHFNIHLANDLHELEGKQEVVVRTHGIPKQELEILKSRDTKIIDATCPYVTTPQQIVEKMNKEGYGIVIFGDRNHPEIKGVVSYAGNPEDVVVVLEESELDRIALKSKIAVVSQTTKKPGDFAKVVSALLGRCKEVRVFNTICNATFENQDAAAELAKRADVMIVIGGKHSSNTKQLHLIAKRYCKDSYLVENEQELKEEWFRGKSHCGISAGASTPDWVIENVINKIKEIEAAQCNS